VEPSENGTAQGTASKGDGGDAAGSKTYISAKDLSQLIDGYQQAQLNHLPHQNVRVGDILISEGLVTRVQVENALAAGEKKKIGAVLIERGLVSEDQLLAALAARFTLRFIDLTDVAPSSEALNALSKSIVNQMKVLPLYLQGKKLIVATSEPTDNTIADSLSFITNYNIELVIAVSRQISAAINKYYNNPSDALDNFISQMEDDQPTVVEPQEEDFFVEPDSKVILLVNKILIEAYNGDVSDIHFEPELDRGPLTVRYRVDGECVVSHEIPTAHKNAVIARLKIMAKLDIAERRKPQSGKIFLQLGTKKIEYRVEITPTVEGHEDAVLRLLTATRPLGLKDMGFSAENLSRFKEMLAKPYGIILCAGPTGSGKTTTLHSALATINTPERKIWTAEDPVEIVQKGLRQVQVRPKIGFGFAEALRSFLRADPDVIMIGEMRDAETTKTAVAASLTGHLVFSTLHTNSAPETVGRLIEIGVDPYNFADALLGILAQRLARRLCDQCKVAYRPSREEYEELVAHYGEKWYRERPDRGDHLLLMENTGCPKCWHRLPGAHCAS
jgi:type II secretory ATPase GspE/PulE/Tfp pilus assembly ATPase PilB-like protein